MSNNNHDDNYDGIIRLLKRTSIASLATQGQNYPECSMVPYALFEDKILIHLSALARHSKNIIHNTNVGLMICTPEHLSDSPLSLPRISLHCTVSPVPSESLDTARSVYLESIPDAEPLFSFGDFTLLEANIDEIYWVGGFGAAKKITKNSWTIIVSRVQKTTPHEGSDE